MVHACVMPAVRMYGHMRCVHVSQDRRTVMDVLKRRAAAREKACATQFIDLRD